MITRQEITDLKEQLQGSVLFTTKIGRSASIPDIYFAKEVGRGVIHIITGPIAAGQFEDSWRNHPTRKFEVDNGRIVRPILGNTEDWKLLVDPNKYSRVKAHGKVTLVLCGKIGQQAVYKLAGNTSGEVEEEELEKPKRYETIRQQRNNEALRKMTSPLVIHQWMESAGIKFTGATGAIVMQEVSATIERLLGE